MQIRQARIERVTSETDVVVHLTVDGSGKSSVRTGIGFFDHMLKLFAKHGVLDLKLRCKGDLEVDAHHTVEDCGIALGQAFLKALGDKAGIRRYGTGFRSAGIRSRGRLMCRWTSAWPGAWWISAAGRTWSGGV